MKARSKPPLNLVSNDPTPESVDPATPHAAVADSTEVEDGRGATSTRTADAARGPSPAAPVRDAGASRWPWFWAGATALLWIVGLGGFVVGFERGLGAFAFEPFRVAVFALLALAPLGLVFALAYTLRQAGRLRAEVGRARALTDDMVAPAAQAAVGVAGLVRELQTEIATATAAAERARRDLSVLRELLAQESARLNEASEGALRTAERLGTELGREREALGALGAGLDAQAQGVAEVVERQTGLVTRAADLAQAQLREAEATLVARTADLAAAAGDAQDAARLAAEDLGRQTLRLETAGAGVAEQIKLVEEGVSQQRAALVAAAFTLRSDHEDFSVQIETQRARLGEALDGARSASAELTETSARGAETLRALVDGAASELRRFAEASDREQTEFEARSREALTRLGRLAAETRDALQEETERAVAGLGAAVAAARRAAAESVESARTRADALGEAVFEAGRRADAAFEARLNDARRLVEQSALLVDEAGARATARMDGDLGALRSALAELEAGVAEIDARARTLPDEARARVEAVKIAVEEGLTSLADAARKAAAETQAVDLAFQERVKRNYDMLSEAVQLMGVVSGARAAPPSTATEAAPEPVAAPEPPVATPEPKDPASAAGLRPRLKLTPTATDEEFRNVFGQASGRTKAARPPAEPEGADGWTWKELLGGMDEAANAPIALDEAAAELIEEIEALGVDSAALLPRPRVEEAARALADGDPDAVRRSVRRVAPAAVRRLSRRVLSERAVRLRADAFVVGWAQGLAGLSAEALTERLSTTDGRAWLLIDAAVGDAL